MFYNNKQASYLMITLTLYIYSSSNNDFDTKHLASSDTHHDIKYPYLMYLIFLHPSTLAK